jgi:hypothetical protein
MRHCPGLRNHHRSQFPSVLYEFLFLIGGIWHQLPLCQASRVHTSISHEHQVDSLGTIPANVKLDQFHALHRDFITADTEGREWVLESQE